MRIQLRAWTAGLFVGAVILATTPSSALAQGREKADTAPAKEEGIEKIDTAPQKSSPTFTPEVRVTIRDYYERRDAHGIQSLPPGIQRRLARGKPLPPGIAKQVVPSDLRSRLLIPKGYEVVEVGPDVLMVEIATRVVHDILRDVVR